MGRVLVGLHLHPSPQEGQGERDGKCLSRRVYLLNLVKVQVIGFESLPNSYADCPDFGHVLRALLDGPSRDHKDFLVVNRCLFFRSRLCVPCTSLRDFLTWKCHTRGLFGHFSRNKTIVAVEYQFYWPTLKRDVGNINALYKQAADMHRRPRIFQVGDQVMVRMRPKRYAPSSATKLHARSAGPFRVLS
ncbi:unnamed protein product [Spirodela intermedia]|uniref:Integrase zinc-binding domain-containing protein n=1 Tax=Spirodela intermedia TaxID=51605 RepID=A0A7I8KVI3_SPIIN|nr:unnamed protein product [Spirodela intermedia]